MELCWRWGVLSISPPKCDLSGPRGSLGPQQEPHWQCPWLASQTSELASPLISVSSGSSGLRTMALKLLGTLPDLPFPVFIRCTWTQLTVSPLAFCRSVSLWMKFLDTRIEYVFNLHALSLLARAKDCLVEARMNGTVMMLSEQNRNTSKPESPQVPPGPPHVLALGGSRIWGPGC